MRFFLHFDLMCKTALNRAYRRWRRRELSSVWSGIWHEHDAIKHTTIACISALLRLWRLHYPLRSIRDCAQASVLPHLYDVISTMRETIRRYLRKCIHAASFCILYFARKPATTYEELWCLHSQTDDAVWQRFCNLFPGTRLKHLHSTRHVCRQTIYFPFIPNCKHFLKWENTLSGIQ